MEEYIKAFDVFVEEEKDELENLAASGLDNKRLLLAFAAGWHLRMVHKQKAALERLSQTTESFLAGLTDKEREVLETLKARRAVVLNPSFSVQDIADLRDLISTAVWIRSEQYAVPSGITMLNIEMGGFDRDFYRTQMNLGQNWFKRLTVLLEGK